MRTVSPDHREADDAPPRPRRPRRRMALLWGVLVLAFAARWWLGRDPAPSPVPPPADVVAAPAVPVQAAPPPPAVDAPAAPSPPPAPLPSSPPPSSPTPSSPRPRPTPAKTELRVTLASVSGGDAAVRTVVDGVLRRSLAKAGVVIGDGGTFSLTLQVQNKDDGDTLQVRCAASIARLPGRNIVGALNARADVGAGDAPVRELYAEAADACARTLAGDLQGWLRAHR
jgi:hypothetical protein